MKRVHMSLSVRGALKWNKRELKDATTWLLKPDGSRYSPEGLREALMDELAQGNECLPMGECEGFNPKTGCPGHEVQDGEGAKT